MAMLGAVFGEDGAHADAVLVRGPLQSRRFVAQRLDDRRLLRGADGLECPGEVAPLLHQVAPPQQRRGHHDLERVGAEHLAVYVSRELRGAAGVLLADH